MTDGVEKVCGNCKWAKDADENNIACFGAPPCVVPVGQIAPKLVGGPPSVRLEAFYPIIRRQQPACRVFEEKEFALLGEMKPALVQQGH